MKNPVKLLVNGTHLEAEKDDFLLGVLLQAGFDVPHLCNLESVTPYASCRLCLVEIVRSGSVKIVTSCNYPVTEDIEVRLDTPEILEERSCIFELLLAQAPGSAKLRRYATRYGVSETTMRAQEGECILCGLCERICNEVIGVCAIGFSGRWTNKELTVPQEGENTLCIGCGSCARSCPTGCIKIEDIGLVRRMPSLRVTLELVPCQICGEATLTQAHARWLAERTKIPEGELYICDRCKAKQTSRTISAII